MIEHNRQAPTEYDVALETTHETKPRSEDLAAEVLSDIIDAGAHIPNEDEVLEAINRGIDRAADRRAAEALLRILCLLGDSPEGVALRRVLVAEKEPLREAAKRARVSHVALWKREKRLRIHLAEWLGLTSPALSE